MEYNIDLHLHSRYSAACSKNTTLKCLANGAKEKGLDVLGTSDILHPKWFEEVKENLVEEDGCFLFKEDLNNSKKTYFILTTEVETKGRIHHLLFFKDFETVLNFKKKIINYSSDMESYGGGRPRLSLSPKELLDITLEFDILIGPAHAFTPYYGFYSKHDSLKEGYGNNYKKIKFIELGLSASTKTANLIPELKDLHFFSFSDAHSSKSYRLGREFVRVDLQKPNYNELEKLLSNSNQNKILLNIGYNPEEGKYNRSACSSCGQIYDLDQSINNNWKCMVCGKSIRKGVVDRIKEIAKAQGNSELKDKRERPPYRHLIPLSEIIQIALNKKNIENKEVKEIYTQMLEHGTEIDLVLNISEEKLKEINPLIAKYIFAFREGFVVFKRGGGGFYGKPFICFSEEEKERVEKEIREKEKLKIEQKKLF